MTLEHRQPVPRRRAEGEHGFDRGAVLAFQLPDASPAFLSLGQARGVFLEPLHLDTQSPAGVGQLVLEGGGRRGCVGETRSRRRPQRADGTSHDRDGLVEGVLGRGRRVPEGLRVAQTLDLGVEIELLAHAKRGAVDLGHLVSQQIDVPGPLGG